MGTHCVMGTAFLFYFILFYFILFSEFPFCQMEKVLEVDVRGGSRTTGRHLMLFNCILKIVNFMLCIFLPQLKKRSVYCCYL